jgi:hypothetical protein
MVKRLPSRRAAGEGPRLSMLTLANVVVGPLALNGDNSC